MPEQQTKGKQARREPEQSRPRQKQTYLVNPKPVNRTITWGDGKNAHTITRGSSTNVAELPEGFTELDQVKQLIDDRQLELKTV